MSHCGSPHDQRRPITTTIAMVVGLGEHYGFDHAIRVGIGTDRSVLLPSRVILPFVLLLLMLLLPILLLTLRRLLSAILGHLKSTSGSLCKQSHCTLTDWM